MGGGTDLLQIEHPGLHPGHLHLLIHLINVPFDQTHRQSLHHQELHLQDTSRVLWVKYFSKDVPMLRTLL